MAKQPPDPPQLISTPKSGRILPLPKSKSQEERIIALETATAESVSRAIFEKEFGNLKESLTEQKTLSFGIIIGIVVVFIFTIGAIGAELLIFHAHQNDELHSVQTQFDSKILEIKEKEIKNDVFYRNEIESLKKQMDELKHLKK